MSDPQRRPGDHPRRAEPLQPDKPGSGRNAESGSDGKSKRDSLRKAKEQEGAAVDNAREGYD
jgi:hypothetical protein